MASTRSGPQTPDEKIPATARSGVSRKANAVGKANAGVDQPTDAPQVDHRRCQLCETQLAEFEFRLAQIERQLNQLTAAMPAHSWLLNHPSTCDDSGRAGPSELARSDSCSRGLPLDSLTEDAVDRARPIDDRNDESTDVSAEASPSMDLPLWAQEYQNDDVDQSVKDYVEHLLQRVGDVTGSPDERKSEASSESRPTLRAPKRDDEALTPTAVASEDRDQPIVSSVPDEPVEPLGEPRAPRSIPPEGASGLSELRQVANLSARAAVRAFEKSRAARQAINRLPMILVGLACGAVLLFFAMTRSSGDVPRLLYTAAAVSIFAGAVAGWQAVTVLCRWMFADLSALHRSRRSRG